MSRLLLFALAVLLAAPSASAQRCNIAGNSGATLSAIRAQPGQTFTVSYNLISVGDGPCPEIEVGHYLSTDRYFSADDVLLGTTTLPPSQPQSNVPGSGQVTIPAGTLRGGYAVLVVADHLNQVPEISEGDNVEFGRLTIGGDLSGPDLTVIRGVLEDATAAPGDRISFAYSVENRGQTDAQEVVMGYYLVRRNSGQTPPPVTELGRETIGNVEAGEIENESEQVSLPPDLAPGQYNVAVEADYDNLIEESDETNNGFGVGILTVTANTAEEAEPGASALSLAASPNPASASVQFTYTLTEARTVRVSVVDALGRTVTVIDGVRGAGVHTEALDTAAWAPGVYVARLAAGRETAVQTITVTR